MTVRQQSESFVVLLTNVLHLRAEHREEAAQHVASVKKVQNVSLKVDVHYSSS
jgi:hypothetical protein